MPGRSAQRRQLGTLQAAAEINGGSVENRGHALDGMIHVSTVLKNGKITDITKYFCSSKKMKKEALVKKKAETEGYKKSNENLICSLSLLYAGGVIGKVKYEHGRSSLVMKHAEKTTKKGNPSKQRITFGFGIPNPRPLAYKALIHKIAEVDIEELVSVRETLCATLLLCREVLAPEVYKHKKGTNEAGRLWDEIAKNLRGCQTVRFKSNLSQQAVRERFNLIQGRFKENEQSELAPSGIPVPEQDELDVLLEDIAETERDAIAEASEKKGQEKATAEDIRNQALERMGQTKKRKSEDGQEPKERKSRRSSNEALQFMQKAESDKAFREEELKIRKKRRRNQLKLLNSKLCSPSSNPSRKQ